MKLAYLFPEELPMRHARGVQAVNTVWALAKQLEVLFLPARFSEKAREFYGLPAQGPYIIPVSRQWGPFKWHFLYLFRILPHLRRVALVYTRHLKTAWWLLRLRPIHRRPVFYEAHELFAEKNPSWKKKEDQVLQGVQALICVSHGLRRAIEERVSRTAHVVPNGTHWEELDLRKKFASCASEFYYVGSLRYSWKGGDTLYQALEFLPSELKLVVIGAEGRAHPQIIWQGYLPPSQSRQALKRAQIAVLPNSAQNRQSREYTCPLKLLDYMAAGCAIVASDLPSVREIVSEKEALFVPPDDPRALAQGIKALWQEQDLRYRLAQAAHQRAQAFSWEARAQHLQRICFAL